MAPTPLHHAVAARCQASDCPVTPACVEMVERYLAVERFAEAKALDLASYRMSTGSDHVR